MNTLTLDAWCKPPGADRSHPIGLIHFRVSEHDHLRMEELEEQLQHSDKQEVIIPVDMAEMEMQMPENCSALEDCALRIYINDDKGQFHLVGHRLSDHALIYSGSVMVDQLG